MTEIEKKALALVNEVNRLSCCHLGEVGSVQAVNTLLRAIEEHEAYRQEVSDSIEHYLDQWKHSTPSREVFACQFGSFIITKPDPLVEAWNDMLRESKPGEDRLDVFRAALAKRGLQVTEIER